MYLPIPFIKVLKMQKSIEAGPVGKRNSGTGCDNSYNDNSNCFIGIIFHASVYFGADEETPIIMY